MLNAGVAWHIFSNLFVLWGLCGFEGLAAAHEHNISVSHSAGYRESKDLDLKLLLAINAAISICDCALHTRAEWGLTKQLQEGGEWKEREGMTNRWKYVQESII